MVVGPHRTSPRDARRFVSQVLREWGRADLEAPAALLVSELVTNVVLHAGTSARLVLRRVGGGVRAEVHDGDPSLPMMKSYGTEATTGRGLTLVEMLAASWGSERQDSGKVVWFELGEDELAGQGCGP